MTKKSEWNRIRYLILLRWEGPLSCHQKPTLPPLPELLGIVPRFVLLEFWVLIPVTLVHWPFFGRRRVSVQVSPGSKPKTLGGRIAELYQGVQAVGEALAFDDKKVDLLIEVKSNNEFCSTPIFLSFTTVSNEVWKKWWNFRCWLERINLLTRSLSSSQIVIERYKEVSRELSQDLEQQNYPQWLAHRETTN